MTILCKVIYTYRLKEEITAEIYVTRNAERVSNFIGRDRAIRELSKSFHYQNMNNETTNLSM
ncbi:MAG: hypothetical protein DLM72_02230 [Candidatus Nitrosopolaris wilkensis]|nr:MAG: hypothetical protein DLM72_02230 [Candidatus Nitrosopolaris wilkensis]